MALKSRLAVIAGGFGGIGLATGRKLRSQGASLALLYAPFEASRKQDIRDIYAQNTPSESKDKTSSNSSVEMYECDVTDSASVERAFAAIAQTCTPEVYPSILVNAAGYVNLTPLENTPPEDTVKHLHINVLGPMLVSQAFARLFFRFRNGDGDGAGAGSGDKRPGRIVSLASQAAHVALDNHGAYCASKAALIGLTKCMASEWAGRGITANTVSPGPVWTEMGKKAWADQKVREEYQTHIPTGRFAEPEEVADAVVYLCGDGTTMVNGTDLRLDGGFTIR